MKKLIYNLKRPYHFLRTGILESIPAQFRFGFPARKLKVITITGTDGKTTSSTLTYHILNQAGLKTGLISTVTAKIGNQDLETGLHTTVPSPKELNSFLAQMVKAKCQYVVLEMTSHGVYQFRDWGIKPKVVGLTNITHEHLDYHLDYDSYVAAKCLLLSKAPVVILNQDDKSFYRIKQRLDLKKHDVNSYSAHERLGVKLNQAVKTRFPQDYNQMNARLAIKIAQELNVSDEIIAQAIINFPGVPGRLEEVKAGQKFRVIVDFAHTPNALDVVLSYLKKEIKKNKTGKLIAVFGSAGLRDHSKRPIMGQKATEHADLVVLTSEDVRTEDPWTIIQQIKSGVTNQHNKIISITDRYQAIKFALTVLAKPGDIVALLGKGPEKSQAMGKKEIPWSDSAVAMQIIKHNKHH